MRFIFVALLLLLISCSTQASICSAQAECEGWNAATQDACEEELEGADEVASEYDCEEAFDTYIDCIDDTGTCNPSKNNDKWETNCGRERDALNACQKASRERDD